MKKYVNGEYLELTKDEMEQMWDSKALAYDEEVNRKIREKYTESMEFAILRQRDEKPEEFREYYEYCEWCKKAVKDSM